MVEQEANLEARLQEEERLQQEAEICQRMDKKNVINSPDS